MEESRVEVRIRPMRLEDLLPVVRIANQSFLETARLTRLMGQRFSQYMRECADWLFVAEALDGRVVGFVFGHPTEGSASIQWIAVHPEFQGRGIGGMLLKAIEAKARGLGLKAIVTGTPFALRFYEKHGFKCTGIRRRLILDLVGRSVEPPKALEGRPITLEGLKPLIPLMDREEYLRFLSAYFRAYESDSEKALAAFAENRILGVIIGCRDDVYPELITLSYIFVRDPRYAHGMLELLAYMASAGGHRWVGVELPIPYLEEGELFKEGWQEAQLPSFWTGYQLRKEL